ncbi:MAG: type 4a pilus biogenesis protein PilO [Planctomycetota bacterium]
MKFTPRDGCVVVAALVVVAAVWWFGVRNAEHRRQALERETTRMNHEADALGRTNRRIAGDRADQPSVEPALVERTLRLVNDALPTVDDAERLLADLYALAQAHGLELERVAALPMRTEPAFCEQPVRLELLGTFEAFYAFLLSLEASPQVMRVTGLDLRKVAAADEPMCVLMELSLFFRPDDQAPNRPRRPVGPTR